MFSDYIFISMADQVGHFAQRLARKYRTDITITIIAGETVTPDRCPNCKDIMPESGPCWCSSFEEEEL